MNKYLKLGIILIVIASISMGLVKLLCNDNGLDYDKLISYTLDGNPTDIVPSKDSGYIVNKITCKSKTNMIWDNTNWKVSLNNLGKNNSCVVNFVSSATAGYLVNLTATENSEYVDSLSKSTIEGGTVTFYPSNGYAISSVEGCNNATIKNGDLVVENVTGIETCNVTLTTGYTVKVKSNNAGALLENIKVVSGSSAEFSARPGHTLQSITCSNGSSGTISGTKLTISNITQDEFCEVTTKKYEVQKFKDKLLEDNPIRLTRTNFDDTFTEVNTETLYMQSGVWTDELNGDGIGEVVYYFAGQAQKNWVKFGKNSSGADLYWRIIRTNEDGGIRLLYVGTSVSTTAGHIGISYYNDSKTKYYDSHAGYMYGTTGSLANHRKNTTSSVVKNKIDSWYNDGLNTKTDGTYKYDSYVSKTAIYCNDRSKKATSEIFYAYYYRGSSPEAPSYKCGVDETGTLYSTADVADKFSVSTTSGGNGKLTYPVALITADELSYAGNGGNSIYSWWQLNSQNTSVTGSNDWWTMTPLMFGTGAGFMQLGTETGSLGGTQTTLQSYIRPVLSLKSCTMYAGGDGSSADPYLVAIDDECAAAEN